MRARDTAFVFRPLLGVCAVLVACGGTPKAPAPATPTTVDVDAGVEPPTPAAEDASAPPALSSEDAGAATSAPPAAEPLDACTAVSAALEKRVRPKLQACYREGKKKTPNLEGKVRLSIDVDTLGKVHATKVIEKTLPDAVANCMLKALKAEPFAEADKCPGKAVIIPIQFPSKSRSEP
jgi:hypothetical protein